MKYVNAKYVFIFVAVSILATSLIWYAFSPTSTTTFYVTGGEYPTTASYIMWREGSNYFCKQSNGLIPSWGSSTNVSYVVQNAFNTINTNGGGELFFMDGVYVFPTTVYMYDNTVVSGEGAGSVIRASFASESIFRTEGFVPGNERTSTPHENITVKGLSFYGTGTGGVDVGFDCARVTDVTVKDCYFDYLEGYGTKIWASNGVYITNCVVRRITAGEGIHVVWGMNVRIIGNTVYDTYDCCIAVPLCTNATVQGNTVSKTSTTINPSEFGACFDLSGCNYTVVEGNVANAERAFHGFMLQTFEVIPGGPTVPVHPVHVTIANNIVKNAHYYGISITGATANINNEINTTIVTGNQFINCGRFGIHILRAGYGIINNNLFMDCSSKYDNTYDVIQVNSAAGANNSTHWSIQNNIIFDTGGNNSRYGILLTAGAHYCIVTGNIVNDCDTGYIQDSGVGNSVYGNVENDVWVP